MILRVLRGSARSRARHTARRRSRGVTVPYDEQVQEAVGLTIVGVGRRLETDVKRKTSLFLTHGSLPASVASFVTQPMHDRAE